jgi:exodeoxyribonuclease VII large subunit
MMPEGTLSLSDLLGRVAKTLKKEFPGSYWIVAEVLELQVNQRGHCYLELIEKSPGNDSIVARARATIWASKFQMLKPYFEATTGMPFKSGIKLLCKGSLEFHVQYGFSINISDIDPSYTLGDLARKKQEVIRRLREEGIMDMNRGLPFPEVPQRIAVISSETAAGYGDFMETMMGNSHGFHFRIRLYNAVMQGEEAPASIIAALDEIFRSVEDHDCVVIIRGGGSRADLECFNDYDLAFYITQFPLPVLTGIGHERDESVADLVAAHSLKTPTAAAEFLVDRLLAFEFRLSALMESLSSLVRSTVQYQQVLLERLVSELSIHSRGFLQRRSDQLDQSSRTMHRSIGNLLARKRDHLSLLETRRTLVNPENILKRGYSMTLHKGKAISGVEGVDPEDMLETRLFRGTITSKVEKTTPANGKRKN